MTPVSPSSVPCPPSPVPDVRLDLFEGPVELLLYLVRKNELDVIDVPVGRLTDDFLASVRQAHELDMESASDFLIMAAILLRMKTRALLPRSPEEDLTTPTISLEQILDEFRRYQQVARLLSDKESERRLLYPRVGESPRSKLAENEDVIALTAAFRRVLSRLTPDRVAQIAPPKVRLEDKIADLRRIIRERKSVDFEEVVTGTTVSEVIVLFIAVLELVRLGELRVRQEAEFGTIRLELREPEPEVIVQPTREPV